MDCQGSDRGLFQLGDELAHLTGRINTGEWIATSVVGWKIHSTCDVAYQESIAAD